MTARLYYDDSYLRGFTARVVSVECGLVYLDRTAFYPTSGGQPHDLGSIGGRGVIEVSGQEDRVAHRVDGAVAVGAEVECLVDWGRRFDHMQQHTGQHLLSAVLAEEHGIGTVSFHLGTDTCTIDVDAASVAPALMTEVERRVNAVVTENRPVGVSYRDSREDIGLRRPSDREGTIRVVTIADLDRSACGGTHVRATGEIGSIALRKTDRIRGITRIEFVCGARATARARADFDALSQTARAFSAPIDEVPGLVAEQIDKLAASDKARRKIAMELAQLRGAELHRSAEPNAAGWKTHVRRIASGALEEDIRAEAQAFVHGGRAVYLAAAESSGALLLAVSPDGPFAAGEALKKVVAKFGGRGGGNAALAQGSTPPASTGEAIGELLASAGQ